MATIFKIIMKKHKRIIKQVENVKSCYTEVELIL